jgi:hypothetical protein
MKTKLTRLEIIQEYECAPEWVLFNQDTVAAIRNCSLATIERDRWAGTGIPFIKMGRLVRYRKSDISEWLQQQRSHQSTTGTNIVKGKEHRNENNPTI